MSSNLDKHLFGLIRKVYPSLIALDIAAVQPMDRPNGKVFFRDQYRSMDMTEYQVHSPEVSPGRTKITIEFEVLTEQLNDPDFKLIDVVTLGMTDTVLLVNSLVRNKLKTKDVMNIFDIYGLKEHRNQDIHEPLMTLAQNILLMAGDHPLNREPFPSSKHEILKQMAKTLYEIFTKAYPSLMNIGWVLAIKDFFGKP